jgi:YkoP domain
LIFSEAPLIANALPARGPMDVPDVLTGWSAAAIAKTGPGQRPSWPHRLVRKLDDALRRFYGVREFSDQPGCLLRIALGRAAAGICLANGYEVPRGAAIIELHLWNEHLSRLSSSGSSLGAAATLRRQIDVSLCELADYIEFEPALAGIVALRARTALVPEKRLGKLLRIVRAFGFDTVARDAPDSLGTRVHDFWENFLIWALAWTAFNPTARRRNGLLRPRCEVWISRDALMAKYNRNSVARPLVAAIAMGRDLLAATDGARGGRSTGCRDQP